MNYELCPKKTSFCFKKSHYLKQVEVVYTFNITVYCIIFELFDIALQIHLWELGINKIYKNRWFR